MEVICQGAPLCITVTQLQGLVLGRSWMHHSMNYSSVVLFGQAHPVTDPEEKWSALEGLMEFICPGRASNTRPPTEFELKATAVAAFPIIEGTVKQRQGPPIDDEEDLQLPVWAGVLPLKMMPGELTAAHDNIAPIPEYLTKLAHKMSANFQE